MSSQSSHTDKLVKQFQEETHRILANQQGYQSWGIVLIQHIYIKTNDYILALTCDAEGHLSPVSNDASMDEGIERMFKKRKSIRVVLITRQQFASRVEEKIPPILDDQAQLLGPSLRFLPANKLAEPRKVYKALKGRYALNLGNGTTLCIGKDLEEAFIAAQLVEKTSKAFLGARALGGAKAINWFEAWAMHKFYMLKYSKESEKNK